MARIFKIVGFCLVIFWAGFAVPGFSQIADSAPATSVNLTDLKVITRVVPPFVLKDNDKYQGFSVEL